MKHLHVIGICGTAMAGLAAIAQTGGWRVTGSDSGIYPPMSLFLAQRGIPIHEGYKAENLQPAPDLVLVGNAISRGNPELEALLDTPIPYTSGAEWLFDHVLSGRHPIVVAGTHGKTTTTSLTAWLFHHGGRKPGFLIGGLPKDFGEGARYPDSEWVVVEGDEYDTAFFDKRPKFLHYRPRTLILHNLEYDHADIYPDLESIRVQFRLLLRTVPPSGLILANGDDAEVTDLVEKYAFSQVVRYGIDGDHPFKARLERPDGSAWSLLRDGETLFTVQWSLLGRHNVLNGLAAAAAAVSRGIPAALVQEGLLRFSGVARRLELSFRLAGISVYDDFAHHPTAIATTLAGLRAGLTPGERLWAVVEPRSNTMRRRIHQERLPEVLGEADRVVITQPGGRLQAQERLDVDWVVGQLNQKRPESAVVLADAAAVVHYLVEHLRAGDKVVIMSNGGFDGLHGRLQAALSGRVET